MERMRKISGDAKCAFVFEMLVYICVIAIIGQNEQPAAVNHYLEMFLAGNGLFTAVKLALFVVLVERRSPDRSEWYQILVQFLQSMTNTVFYILSYTSFGDDVQKWFWNSEEESDNNSFFVEIMSLVLGLWQYYFLFLFGCLMIIVIVALFIFVFNGCRRDADGNDE